MQIGTRIGNLQSACAVGSGAEVENGFLAGITGDDDVRIQRKVQEILRALNLEKEKSKEEIL